MIYKLRIKFILATMISLFVVLAVIIGATGIISYDRLVTNADSVLSILQENDGTFPVSKHPEESLKAPKSGRRDNSRVSPELPFESRYFSVSLNSDGIVQSVNIDSIAAVDAETAKSYAEYVQTGSDTKGFIGDYRFTLYTKNGETHIIFLDCGREMSSFRAFLVACTGVSLIGLAAVCLLMTAISYHIVKPFVENYEKQKRFITDAGHELKTPLTIINADTEILEMDVGENEWLSDIKTQTTRLSKLTNSLIQLSRLEESPLMEMIDFPISDITEEAADAFQAPAKIGNKTLISDIEKGLSMYGDENAIRQLANILLDNAVKYANDGGRIVITLKKQKNMISLSVFNTVQSIKREDITHIFDRFYRTDESRNSMTGGYGLGLSIAYVIVNAHKGKISAETKDEKSLKITANFPISGNRKKEKGSNVKLELL